MEINFQKLNEQEKTEYFIIVLDEINKVISKIPPVYAYGDNEAGCYMAQMLQEIQSIIYNCNIK
jgi:hypothetical protein